MHDCVALAPQATVLGTAPSADPGRNSGDASSSIITAADQADLVVMSSHGRGGLARMALGSVTDAVIRGSGKPV